MNGQKRILESLSVEIIAVEKDSRVKINRGGFTGENMYYSYAEGKSNVYISFGKGSVGPSNSYGGNKGVSFTTGSVFYQGEEYGLFLNEIIGFK